MEYTHLGQRIAALRKAQGLTQRQLAEDLNVSDKAVSRWERGESSPDLSLIPLLADRFGITCDELLRGTSAPATDPKTDKIGSPLPIVAKALVLMGPLALFGCYEGLGYRYATLGFCLELAFFLAAGCVMAVVLTRKEPRGKESTLNLAAAMLAILGVSIPVLAGLDLWEILLVGLPLGLFGWVVVILFKWFRFCPDATLRPLRDKAVTITTAALIVVWLFGGLLTSVSAEGGLIFALIGPDLTIPAAAIFYRLAARKQK